MNRTLASKKALALVSAALFATLLLGLYKTVTTTPNLAHGAESAVADKLASSAAEHLQHTTGRVLDDTPLLTLHDSPATYPRLARLSDGSILLGMTRFENAPAATRVLSVSRSVDGGRTFAPWGEVTRCGAAAHDCDNLFLLEAAPGRVLAAFRNHDVVAGRHAYFRITVCESRDGGRSWAFLAQAAEKPAPWGLWEPFMWLDDEHDGGVLHMTYSREHGARDQDTESRSSRDGGRSWSAAATTLTGAGEELRDGMTGVAATTDAATGRRARVLVMETTRRGATFTVEAVVAYEGEGEAEGAWGHRQVVYEPPDDAASNAGAPQIGAFAHGGLAVVFMGDMDVERGARDWPRRAGVKVVFGGPLVDGRVRWRGPPQDACPEPSFWPGLLELDGARILVACEHDGGIRGRILEWA